MIPDDISLVQFVIPGLTRNPALFWIPAFSGMTVFDMINVALYNFWCLIIDYLFLFGPGRSVR